MPRGRKDIKSEDGRPFSKENQPSREAKIAGHRRVKNIKKALAFFGEQLKESVLDEEGNSIEISREASIISSLYQKAENGDLKAIDLLSKLAGWYHPMNVNHASVDKPIGVVIVSDD